MPEPDANSYSSKLAEQAQSKVGCCPVDCLLGSCPLSQKGSTTGINTVVETQYLAVLRIVWTGRLFLSMQADLSYSYWAAGQSQSTTSYQEKVCAESQQMAVLCKGPLVNCHTPSCGQAGILPCTAEADRKGIRGASTAGESSQRARRLRLEPGALPAHLNSAPPAFAVPCMHASCATSATPHQARHWHCPSRAEHRCGMLLTGRDV